MLGGLLLVGKVRVTLDRDRRILDIRYDLGHRRGDIGRLGGLADDVGCRPLPLKDSPPYAAAARQRPGCCRGRTPSLPATIAACQAKHHGRRARGAIGVVIISLSTTSVRFAVATAIVIVIAIIVINIDRHCPRGMRHKRHILF